MASNDLQKFCDELRSRLSIVDVVSSKIKLVRKGREYQACCPFHNEKTPSFTVNEAKGFYHCFGCGAHGDIIKFEMEANNLPFIDAVKKLADKAGLQMPVLNREHHEEQEKKKNLYEIMELACQYYEKYLRLPEGTSGLEYFYRRGLNDDIIQKFRLGYAPSNNGLKAYLSSQNISEQDMCELGLLAIPEDKARKSHDFFRGRVMIPIMDKQGRVVAFGGRIIGDGQPKYLNSPETPVFNKRRMLYNMNYARDKGFSERNLIICEGYMDVIALDRYGFGYAVAPLGTALTEEQILEAWKVTPEPILCFDGDNAGVKAAIRSVDRVLPILKAGYSLKYVFLPDKQDPDEFLKAQGSEAFSKYLQNTMPLVHLLWKKNFDGVPVDTPEQKALIEKNIRDEVAKITDETVRGYYQQEMRSFIYNKLGRGAWLKKNQESTKKSPKSTTTNTLLLKSKLRLDELVLKFVLSAMIYAPELVAEYEEQISMFDISHSGLRRLLDFIFEFTHEKDLVTSDLLYKELEQAGFKKELASLWEIQMLREQKPLVSKLRQEIDLKIEEVQLNQLENEIKECLRIIQTSESFSEEIYNRYETLKKEKNILLDKHADI